MKKFYSIIVAALVSLVSMSAGAVTVTFRCDDASADALWMRNPGNGYNPEGLTTEGAEMTGVSFPLGVNDGYTIGTITGSVSGLIYDLTDENRTDYTIDGAKLSEGETVTITAVVASVVETPANLITFHGVADSYYVTKSEYGEQYTPDASGTLVLEWTDMTYGGFRIYTNSGFTLNSVTDASGKSYDDYGSLPGGYAYIGIYNFMKDGVKLANVDLTLDIAGSGSGEAGSKFTLNIDGEAYKVALYNASGSQIYVESSTQEIDFNEGDSFFVSHSYGGTLYKVEQNGNPIYANQYGNFMFTPANGDVVNVYVNPPAVEIGFTINYTGSADKSIISSAYYDKDYSLDKDYILSGDFRPVTGGSLNLGINTMGFENVAVKINGEDAEIRYGSVSVYFAEETDYVVEIYGERMAGYQVTVVSANYQALKVTKDYSGNDAYELTGQVTDLEVERGNSTLYLFPAEGYFIAGVTVDGESYYSNQSVYVSADCEIEVDVVKIDRDRQAVIYLDENCWPDSYSYIALSYYNYDLQKQINLVDGYSFVDFGSFDLPFYFSISNADYSGTAVYVNDVLCEGTYGSSQGFFDATNDLADGSVIKIYEAAVDPFEVTYTISADANVTVSHDYVTEVANPSVHSVLPGTLVRIAPVEVATTLGEDDVVFGHFVNVDGEPVEAGEDGVFEVNVHKDSNIEVKYGVVSGVSAIETDADNADNAIYNLQGIRVNGKNLPAGLYISKGQKIVVK